MKKTFFSAHNTTNAFKIHKQTCWNKIYSNNNNIWTETPSVDLINCNGYLRSPILDFGCGNGKNSLFLANSGFSVVGLDISANAIELANKKLESSNHLNHNLCFMVGDERSITGKFKTILCLGVLQGTSPQERIAIADKLFNCLSPNGYLLVNTFKNDDPEYSVIPEYDRKFHGLEVTLFSEKEFVRIFSGKLKLIHSYIRKSYDNHSRIHKHNNIIGLFQKNL